MARSHRRSADRRQYHRHWRHLADSLIRFLHITRRRVPHDRISEYAQLWERVRAVVGHAGARAWIFHAAEAGNHFIEFIEWQSPDSDAIIERDEIARAIQSLNAAFPFEDSETWKEAHL